MRVLAGTVGGRSGFDDVLEIMEQSIVHDRATGLTNRASFEPLLDAIHERSKQRKIPLGLLIIDCEPLSPSEESPANPPDEILARTAKHIAGMLRSGDPLARLGTRQIAVLLPGCEGENLNHLTARVRNALAAAEDSDGDAPGAKRFRFSLGIAESQPHYPDCDAQQLIVDAFTNLERAKQ
jgi:diguanylate cyclase (GGDEF)-like protein